MRNVVELSDFRWAYVLGPLAIATKLQTTI